MDPDRAAGGRPHPVEVAYVLAVAGLAAWGFLTETTAAILAAAALALPIGLAGLVAYYVVYGLVAQVPGANPDTDRSWSSCSPEGVCRSHESGDLATWFAVFAVVLGIGLLTAAAVANVALLRRLVAKRRG